MEEHQSLGQRPSGQCRHLRPERAARRKADEREGRSLHPFLSSLLEERRDAEPRQKEVHREPRGVELKVEQADAGRSQTERTAQEAESPELWQPSEPEEEGERTEAESEPSHDVP